MPPWPSTIRGQGRSLALCSVAVARAACATRRSSSPPGLGTNRRTCHSHAEKDPVATLDSPLQVACALALNTKAEDAKRQRWHQGARSGAYQAGWRGELAGGGAPEVRAGPRLSLCSVPAAYSRRRGRGWGCWGPLRLCVVGAACSLVIAAGCISGGCGAWWLAAALLMYVQVRAVRFVRSVLAAHLQPPSRPLMGPPGSSHLRFVGVSCSLGRRLVVSQQHHGRSGVSPGPLLSAPPRPAREGGAWRLGEAPPTKPAARGPEPPDFPTLQKIGPDSDPTHTQNERRVAQIYPRVCPYAIHEPRSPLSRLEQPISSFYWRPYLAQG